QISSVSAYLLFLVFFFSFFFFFFFSSRRRHTRSYGDWSSDVCSSDLEVIFRGVPFVEEAGGLVDEIRDEVDASLARSADEEIREIGRASCRERVESSGGGGVMKKKKRYMRERAGDGKKKSGMRAWRSR